MADELRAQIKEIMQDCWNDWCTDTGCFPCDFKVSRGPRLEFHAGSWAGHVADGVIAMLSTRQHASADVPEGYVLVPIEPTKAMISAVKNWDMAYRGYDMNTPYYASAYKSMIGATAIPEGEK